MRRYMPLFQILTGTPELFAEVFKKLVALGFVGGDRRVRTIEDIDCFYRRSACLLIGTDSVCRMVLHGINHPYITGVKTISVDEFIDCYWKEYDKGE